MFYLLRFKGRVVIKILKIKSSQIFGTTVANTANGKKYIFGRSNQTTSDCRFLDTLPPSH